MRLPSLLFLRNFTHSEYLCTKLVHCFMNKFIEEFLIQLHPIFTMFQLKVVLLVDSLMRSLEILKKLNRKPTYMLKYIYIYMFFPILQVNLKSLLLLSHRKPTNAYHKMLLYFLITSISKSATDILKESFSAHMKQETFTGVWSRSWLLV